VSWDERPHPVGLRCSDEVVRQPREVGRGNLYESPYLSDLDVLGHDRCTNGGFCNTKVDLQRRRRKKAHRCPSGIDDLSETAARHTTMG